MSEEIVFILEPDTGRVCVESSNTSANVVKEIKQDLGHGTTLNCGRPAASLNKIRSEKTREESFFEKEEVKNSEIIHLFRLYHHSTVDGPGRRSVIQVAGCSIRCPGCYVPKTHERENGKPTLIVEIVAEIEKRSGEHDGVTILGGEPFDQVTGLDKLVKEIKKRGFNLTIYSGYKLENLLGRENKKIERILKNTDLLIDGEYNRELKNAGEYRGSSNQRLIFEPLLSKYGRKTDE
jgi:anaerobic ribonucleoside-triphosphate reductase activating protein